MVTEEEVRFVTRLGNCPLTKGKTGQAIDSKNDGGGAMARIAHQQTAAGDPEAVPQLSGEECTHSLRRNALAGVFYPCGIVMEASS